MGKKIGYPGEAEKCPGPDFAEQKLRFIISREKEECKNCKHWSGITAALPSNRGMCFLSQTSTRGEIKERQFFAASGLITAPDFGCNQFESAIFGTGKAADKFRESLNQKSDE